MMDHAEQVANVKTALDLSIKIARAEKKIEQLESEKFKPAPKAPVRSMAVRKYPEISTKYKTIEWILPVFPAISFFFSSVLDGSGVLSSIMFSFVIFVGTTVIYFIYRSLYYCFGGKKRLANSRKYKAKCAEVDREAEHQQRMIDEKYLAQKREYDEITLPAYQRELSEWKEVQNQKITVIENELEQLRVDLELHYESTALIPLQYRRKSALRYLYDLMSTSDYNIKEAIELYDRKVQRDLDEAKIHEQRRYAEELAAAQASYQYSTPPSETQPSSGGLLRHAVNAALSTEKPKRQQESRYKDLMGSAGCVYGKQGSCIGCKLTPYCSRIHRN